MNKLIDNLRCFVTKTFYNLCQFCAIQIAFCISGWCWWWRWHWWWFGQLLIGWISLEGQSDRRQHLTVTLIRSTNQSTYTTTITIIIIIIIIIVFILSKICIIINLKVVTQIYKLFNLYQNRFDSDFCRCMFIIVNLNFTRCARKKIDLYVLHNETSSQLNIMSLERNVFFGTAPFLHLSDIFFHKRRC